MADLIQVVVLDCDGNKLRRADGTWETMEIDRTSLGDAFQNASDENIAVQQLPNQPGSVAVVLYDEVEPAEKVSWSRASVLVLIECYRKNKGKLRSGKHKKKHIWQEIVNVIQEETGQLFTIFQVQSKWKNITRKFREIIDHNSKPGNPVKSCNYFAELQEVYKYKPNLRSDDDETYESFCADDGSAESGDETGAANGASPMADEDAISSGNVRSSMLKWSRESVLVLIDCYKTNATKFSSPKHKKKHIWQEIADVINDEAGQLFSWSQVEAKWKNLTKKYRDAVEHNISSSANSTKTCSFFYELQEFYGEGGGGGKTNIKPEAMSTGDSFVAEDGSTESGDETMATTNGGGGGSSRMDVKMPFSLHSVGLKQKWSRESVLVLIACYENNKDKFKSALHKKKHIWQDIAKVINDETGQLFTWFQVEGKWKNLTKKYRDITDQNRSTPGNRKRSCSFYAELKQVYDYKPSGKSKNSSAAAAANNDDDGSAESTYEIADSSEVKTPTTSRSGISRKRRRSSESPQDRVLQTLCKMHEENKVLAAERMAAQKAMHEEKLVMFGQFLDVLKAAAVNKNN